jgi:plastocyanin
VTRRRLRRSAALVVGVVVVGALLAAGCGGADDDDSGARYVEPKGPAVEKIAIEAGNFFFDPDKITTDAGITELTLEGTSGNHTLVFDDAYPGFQLEVVGDETDSKKIELSSGEYTYYCDILGHRAQGMVGTLTVK